MFWRGRSWPTRWLWLCVSCASGFTCVDAFSVWKTRSLLISGFQIHFLIYGQFVVIILFWLIFTSVNLG